MRSRMQGLTLIELMVAMVLGLVVVGGAISLTLANRQSYRTNEGLSQVQESGRTAFELISRDLRQAGVSGCDNEGRVADVLVAGGDWWSTWFGLVGYEDDEDTSAVLFDTGRGWRVNGTDAVQIQGIQGVPYSIESHVGSTMLTDAGATDIVAGDVMIACDFDHATIFQVSSFDSAARTLSHEMGTGVLSPGNCSTGLGFPTDCGSASGNIWFFEPNSMLAHFFATDWYVGQTGRDDDATALFRRRLGPGGVQLTEEVVAGVSDMQLSYRVDGADNFADADLIAPANWANVNAVRVDLTVESADTRVSADAGVNEGRIQRQLSQIVTLRNRVP